MAKLDSLRTEGILHHSTTEIVYVFICDYLRREGFPPCLQEIADGCGLGRSVVVYHLNRLRQWGFIKRSPGRTRRILLVNDELPELQEMAL